MKYQLIAPVTLLLLAAQSAHATGLHRCDAPDRQQWQTQDTLQKKLESDGWVVRKIKEDGGCYEVYATSPDGERGEAYFHPVTLDMELFARRGQVLFRKSDN